MSTDHTRATPYGFTWGHCEVERQATFQRTNGLYRVLKVNDLTVYISPKGFTRVFRNGKELT